ncbi:MULTISPECIES: ABC transporter substrate-binding protein [Streptomyces]|uniref:ABC transporter substrate-binding protein n=1 Tax=Streptomyces glycanivorans TaxID=3033808 RepID=A0ABY9JKX4_9ACTN|nr:MULTISPECIES: ABC transporter substrate-binding protein [unclassified Streptomyces]WSQ81735.1 ABC transporter substrate-binding protein [Streptomyces sp. NBC_01213]TXS12983.1 ABC transporter substrate-binding protein [Streptomyces sp. wa22]WLQ68375.1 ABC transporter substrate-binding protein [Streptomyces sp. Alt3]WSQ89061.1 ABC transporter substrate-binding protein [Streptomyces sp. NBC_01212]WSR04934.1 ABC transporter substrate-binding protein [Streptomyces sp. NBC_01208]
MTEQSAWSFADDRGRLAVADRRPSRVLAYAQAGATLWDYGIRPEGIFGSGHDGAEPDRAKTGTLPLDSVDYRGAGDDLDVDTLLRGRPDLVVAVSYGHGQLYGLDPDTAKHLEESVPVVVIDVGQVRTLDRVAERFAELARSLGGAPVADAADELHAARERLRAAVRTAPGSPRVLALSPAGQEKAYAARPQMWPELRVLAELGVALVSPPDGAGVNWATVDWEAAAALEPDVVLADIRSNAVPLDEVAAPAWEPARRHARTVPWNPEPLCSPQAHARFLVLVADALEEAGG